MGLPQVSVPESQLEISDVVESLSPSEDKRRRERNNYILSGVSALAAVAAVPFSFGTSGALLIPAVGFAANGMYKGYEAKQLEQLENQVY